MKKQFLLLMLFLVTCIGCKKVTIDFTFTPTQPKAGEKVTFANASSKGEEWLWHFGDRDVSAIKSPTHVYNAPGIYQVILKVDNKDSQTCTHTIEVVDTIPTYTSDHDTLPIYVYEDITFMSHVFNPNNDSIYYAWTVQPTCAVSVDSTGGKWTVYFTQAGPVEVTMNLTLNGKTTTLTHTYIVEDKKATAVLMMDEDSAMLRQRMFFNPARAEEITELTYAEGKAILEATQDTLQTVNGYTYRLSELKTILPDMLGFRIAYGKIYFRTTDGLFIADVLGNNIKPVSSIPAKAIYTDIYTGLNRLYWATSVGVYYMPLVDHPQNEFDMSKIVLLNEQSNIIRLAVDTTYRLR